MKQGRILLRSGLGVLLWAGLPASYAQSVSVGLTVGGVISTDFRDNGDTRSMTRSERLLLGPTLRLRMRSGLGFEIGALRKDLGFHFADGRPGLGFTQYEASATMWQIPLLIQYQRSLGAFDAYVSAGPSLRLLTGEKEAGQNCRQLPTVVCTPFSRTELSQRARSTTAGLTLGGGLEWSIGSFNLSPEVRWTRWLSQPLTAPVQSDNQVELLFRIGLPLYRRRD